MRPGYVEEVALVADEEEALARAVSKQRTRAAFPPKPSAGHADVAAPAEWPAGDTARSHEARNHAVPSRRPALRRAAVEPRSPWWLEVAMLGPVLWLPLEVLSGKQSICTRVVLELLTDSPGTLVVLLSFVLRLGLVLGCASSRRSTLWTTFVTLGNAVCLPIIDLAHYLH